MNTPNFDWLLDPPDDGEPRSDELADAQEAYDDYLSVLDDLGADSSTAVSFEAFCRAGEALSSPPVDAPEIADEDIPF